MKQSSKRQRRNGIKTSELDIARYNTLMKKLMCLELMIKESSLSASGSHG